MGRRILNRKDLRADYEAAERRKADDEEVDEEEEAGDEDEDEEEEGGEEEAEGDEEEVDEADEEEAPPKKKKKPVKEVKPKKTRSRAAKIIRMKVVWGVFNNSNQRVAVYEYPKRKEADDHAARLTSDKKSTHFVQPVKEPIEEKKEA
jgi:hypothetical protein